MPQEKNTHRTAIVILNWNGREFLEKFLPSVLEHSKKDAEVIVADNASTDDSIVFLKEHFPEVRIISNSDNGGYAKGYNLALQKVDAEYYVLLNSDIEVTENWVQPVIELMDSDQEIAACQPKILSYYQKDSFEYAGAGGGFIDKFGYPFCRGRIFQSMEKDKGQYDDNCPVFWASGACMFVRAEVFHRVGGFDEDFFAHMEEIDFCWRLKNIGYKIMYCGASHIYHIGGGTLPKSSWRKTYLNIRNNNIMLYKNLPSKELKKVVFARLVLDGIAAFKFLIDGGFKNFWAVVRAHISYYKSMPTTQRKRKKLEQNIVDCIYQGNIVGAHYFRMKNKFSELDPEKLNCSSKPAQPNHNHSPQSL